ncbi:MAG: galactose oxidase early set domain-containing protein [Candidatus Sulfotelmatobacter sp.]
MKQVVCGLIFCAVLASITAFGQSKAASKEPPASSSATLGAWAAPVNFCVYPCLVGANAAVLNTGNVLFYYYPAANTLNSQATLLNPATGALTSVTLTQSADIFCSGLSILQNGTVLVTGGNAEGVKCGQDGGGSGCGTTNSMLFAPPNSTWSAGTAMSFARWYPSSIELANGTLLELSGTDSTGSWVQTALEEYNYLTGKWTTLPVSATLPSAVSQVYPRLSLMPSGNVFLSSPAQKSYLFNTATNSWSYVATVNFGYRYFAPHVLLPGQEKVMVAGGSATKENGGGTATNTAEIIDLSAAKPAWSYTGSLNYARYNENLVLLADGTVLAVGGGGGGGRYANPVLSAELYDPATAQWAVMASQTVQRTYHSTAVLLPDGRVISAGSDNGAPTQVSYEIYSPPYMFKGPRPVIQSAPATLTYGARFKIATPNAAAITRVALVRPSATTHADNFDQRYVDLTFTVGSGAISATAPPNGNEAPPGYYMLVIVNSNGVPSVMPFLQLN